MRRRLAAVALVGVAACSFAPRYERPAAPVPGVFPGAGGGGLAAADRGWRDVFGDPRLRALITVALANNRDLRITGLNIELARAQYRIESSALIPSLNGTATASVAGTTDGIASGFSPAGFTQYRVGLTMPAYELDLWGRVRNLKAGALEDYLRTVETQRAAHLALVRAVVVQYLRERAFAEQQVLAEQTVALVRESVDMTRRLLEAGQRSDLDARTAEAQLHGARAEVIRLTRLHAQAENALALLIGRALPSSLPAPQPLAAQDVAADVPAGLPSELLARRPDILAAEHALRAANADIGVARATFFPQISLTAFTGFASTSLTGLFAGPLAWSVSPQLNAPLFTAGRNRASLDVAKVRKRIEVARYEQAIQGAFREVADALVGRATFDAQLEAQAARAEAEQQRFALSEIRYRNGIESYLVVLAAQQALYQTQAQLIELRVARLTNLADLYAALGGGWR